MHGEDSTCKLFRWKDTNWLAFADFLNNVGRLGMQTVNLTADSLLGAFTRNINKAVKLFVRIKQVTRKPNCWARGGGCVYHNYIKRELARKRCLWRKHRESPHNGVIYSAYREAESRADF